MAITATEKQRLSNVVKREQWPELGFTRVVATAYEAAAKTYRVGEVLGKISASGKVCKAVETASDGSKVFYAICLEDKTVPATTDTPVLVMYRGDAAVNKAGLYLDSTYDNDTKKGVLYADLAALRIKAIDAI